MTAPAVGGGVLGARDLARRRVSYVLDGQQAELTGCVNGIDPVRYGAQDWILGVHRRWSRGLVY